MWSGAHNLILPLDLYPGLQRVPDPLFLKVGALELAVALPQLVSRPL
jgi:hypothetical protein